MTALYIPNIIERVDEGIDFEHLNITKRGTLVNWTFVAREMREGDGYPKLGVLSLVRGPTGMFYVKLKFVENINCTKTPHPNVYECSVTPEPVAAGDFIGLRLPPLSSARLLLSFILNGAPPGQSLSGSSNGGNGEVEGLPLITLGVGKYPLAIII